MTLSVPEISTDSFSGYFDWAATTPPDSSIMQEALVRSMRNFANPSSVHKAGLDAKRLLTEARERCAAALHIPSQSIIFTSGGTESDQLPMLSLLQRPAVRQAGQSRGTIVISAVEHPALREQAESMKHCGFTVISVPPEKNGILSADKLLSKIDGDTLLVCVMAVNNETGCIQPVYRIADALTAKTAGHKRPKFHVDAVQTIGKIPFLPSYPGIDSMALSAHKLRGPRGIGLLYMAQRQEPFIRGGAQENGLRPGTENVFGALALAACLEKYALTPASAQSTEPANAQLAKLFAQQEVNAARFVSEISVIGGCRLIPQERLPYSQNILDKAQNAQDSATLVQEGLRGEHESFSPWIVQASFKGIPGEVLVRALSEKGFYISTGSACSARKMSRPILEAMGISKDEASQAVRFSFGHETTEEDMQRLIAALKEVRAAFK